FELFTMTHYNFNDDLKDGLDAENEVKELLKLHFNVADSDIESSTSKGYDLKINSLGLTFEVKNDLMAEKTGNIAVEYESRGKASGLSTTTADFWVYKFSGVYYMLETSRLKTELFSNKNYWKDVTGGDWGSNTKMYLVKVPNFKSWGEQL
ncbi:MAG TPA: hypothetical protein PK715_09480, partial [Chitinophagales bacterium]|nr:hypothetical protein [Chitinophagales bacterium]